MRLNDLSAEETELSLSSDLTFMGKLGEMGQPLIRKKAETTMEESSPATGGRSRPRLVREASSCSMRPNYRKGHAG